MTINAQRKAWRQAQARYRTKHRNDPVYKKRKYLELQRWRKSHLSEIAAYWRSWYLTHSQYKKTLNKRWTKAHRLQVIRIVENYRARRMQATGSFSSDDFVKITKSQGNRCIDCQKSFDIKHKPTVGHAVPLSKGGSNCPTNIIAQCQPCNSKQGASIHPQFRKKVA